MKVEAESRIAALLASRKEVEVAVLFGSAAAGALRPDSDLDLYLRLRRGSGLALRQQLDLAAEISDIAGREVDLVVEEPTTSVILRREVAARGRALYESRAGAWTDLRAEAMLAYLDLEPYLRRIGASVREAAQRHG